MKFSGTIDHNHKIDASRPFCLSVPRRLVDGYGRPLRGISTIYTYDNEQEAVADFRAAKAAKLRPLLRDFSTDPVRCWK